jgi:cyclophilin family peptidyl-prolyl cis-trans isomerase
VKPKELEIVKGTFVKPQVTKLEPRLTWIVINVNRRKVGKVVMHLHGKDVSRIVDNFLDLKGCELQRDSGNLMVTGMEPQLIITPGGHAGLDQKSGVYGVIQEGRDVFQTVMQSDAGAALSVKQAHIYPVKKGRSGI